jgi:hypothetical protein
MLRLHLVGMLHFWHPPESRSRTSRLHNLQYEKLGKLVTSLNHIHRTSCYLPIWTKSNKIQSWAQADFQSKEISRNQTLPSVNIIPLLPKPCISPLHIQKQLWYHNYKQNHEGTRLTWAVHWKTWTSLLLHLVSRQFEKSFNENHSLRSHRFLQMTGKASWVVVHQNMILSKNDIYN